MRNPVWPSSCVTPTGTSNELDVQNEWEENTHTHTLAFSVVRTCVYKFSGTHGDRGIFFPYSADHEQDWQPYPVDPYSAICDDYNTVLYSTVPYVILWIPCASLHPTNPFSPYFCFLLLFFVHFSLSFFAFFFLKL